MKKKSNGTLIWIIIVVILALNCADEPMALLGILILALICLPGVILYRVARSRRAETEDHSHDRVNHNTDLVIDRNTGKALNRPQSVSSGTHSSKEHWKQQLDILLANGTIDRAEYHTMLRQHSDTRK